MSASTKTINEITFAVWSPQEIRKYSVVEITQPETYDEDGMAVQGGLMTEKYHLEILASFCFEYLC